MSAKTIITHEQVSNRHITPGSRAGGWFATDRIMSRFWKRRLKATNYVVYDTIISYLYGKPADHAGGRFVELALADIADESGMDAGTVKHVLHLLCSFGLLTRHNSGHRGTMIYEVLDAGAAMAAWEAAEQGRGTVLVAGRAYQGDQKVAAPPAPNSLQVDPFGQAKNDPNSLRTDTSRGPNSLRTDTSALYPNRESKRESNTSIASIGVGDGAAASDRKDLPHPGSPVLAGREDSAGQEGFGGRTEPEAPSLFTGPLPAPAPPLPACLGKKVMSPKWRPVDFHVARKSFPRTPSLQLEIAAWDALMPNAPLCAALAIACGVYAGNKAGTPDQFVKHFSTWLNNACWEQPESTVPGYDPAKPLAAQQARAAGGPAAPVRQFSTREDHVAAATRNLAKNAEARARQAAQDQANAARKEAARQAEARMLEILGSDSF